MSTFEPMELYPEFTWEIYDPNTARLVATFHDPARAHEYLEWVNRKQDKKQAKKARAKRARLRSELAGG